MPVQAPSIDDIYSNIEMQSALVTGGWAAARRPVSTPAASPPTQPKPQTSEPTTPNWLSKKMLAGIAVFWTAIGLLWSQQVYFYTLVSQGNALGQMPRLVLTNMVSAWVWGLFTPVVFYLAQRFRLGRERLGPRLTIHLIAAVICASIHVEIGAQLLRPGDFTLISALNANPFTGDLLIYFVLLAWAHGRDFYTWYREREVAGTRIEAAIARSRYQSLCVQLRPQFVLGTLELLERLVHRDATGAERLITRLADVLRMTLDTAADAETTVRKELELLKAYVDVYQQGIRRGARLTTHVPVECLGVCLPNRLLRTLVDDLLAEVASGTDVEVRVDVERSMGTVRIQVSADAPGAVQGSDRAGEPWTTSVEAAALAEADRKVSLFFPDSRTAVVLLADRELDSAAPLVRQLAPAAQPA
jgi:hypothetical protein